MCSQTRTTGGGGKDSCSSSPDCGPLSLSLTLALISPHPRKHRTSICILIVTFTSILILILALTFVRTALSIGSFYPGYSRCYLKACRTLVWWSCGMHCYLATKCLRKIGPRAQRCVSLCVHHSIIVAFEMVKMIPRHSPTRTMAQYSVFA